jgi:hypothetical protein
MFAVFFVEGMNPFYQNIASFPTAIFSFFVIISAFYWLIAVLGLVDIDILDVDLPEPDADIGNINALAGLMMKFGLNGVPVTIIVTLLSMNGWLLCYYGVHFFVNGIEAPLLNFLAGLGVFFASLWVSVMITSVLIRPIRKFFKLEARNSQKTILGQTLIVRTSRIDENFGEATLNDGGAGLVLKVRSSEANSFKKGDTVVPIEYLEEKNAYRVISEAEFLGKTLD